MDKKINSEAVIKSIVKELILDPKMYKENYVYNRISNAKNKLISYSEYVNNLHNVLDTHIGLNIFE